MSISLESKVRTRGSYKGVFLHCNFLTSKVDPAFHVQLFGSLSGHLVPLYCVDAIACGSYEMAKKLIAHSILHGGSRFSGLAPAIVQYLCTGQAKTTCDYWGFV